jgi:hypothetical protein
VIPIRGLPPDEGGEVGHVLRPIGERIGAGKIFNFHVDDVGREMVEPNGALETKRLGPPDETRDGNMVAEHILRPPQIHFSLSLEMFLRHVISRHEHDTSNRLNDGEAILRSERRPPAM